MKHKKLLTILLTIILTIATTSYIFYTIPRPIRAGQVNLNTGTEPKSLSDLINFTQKSNLAESQLTSLTASWEQALRTINRYSGTSQVYKESCTKYNCSGGPPFPKEVEMATTTVGTKPLGVVFNNVTNTIYVANQFSNTVSVINATSNNVIATISLAPQTGAAQIGFNPVTRLVYVANQFSNTVSVINATSNTVLTAIPITGSPIGIGVNPVTNRVFVTEVLAGMVAMINGTSNTLLASNFVGNSPRGVSVNPATNRVYVANFNDNTVSVVNGTTLLAITTIPVGVNPYVLAVNPGTNRIYVANNGASSVSVINGTSNTVLTTIPVGSVPAGIGVNPTTNRVYVANYGASSLSVIDATSNTVLSTVSVGAGPTGAGINPAANRVYVTNYNDNSVSVIGQREEIREPCLQAPANCLVVSSIGTLFPGTPQSTSASLVAVSLHSSATKTGTQMALTVVCDNNTTNPNQQCSAFYVDGNVWGPGQTDLTKSPFIIQNAEPYFYLQFHWWDFNSQQIVAWGTWWYGDHANPNWYWGVYWWWRTYVNYYIGIWLPWWWWVWHWTYWRYWAFWNANFPT